MWRKKNSQQRRAKKASSFNHCAADVEQLQFRRLTGRCTMHTALNCIRAVHFFSFSYNKHYISIGMFIHRASQLSNLKSYDMKQNGKFKSNA